MTLVLLATLVLGLLLWHPNEDVLWRIKDAFLLNFLMIFFLYSMMKPNIYQDKIGNSSKKQEKIA